MKYILAVAAIIAEYVLCGIIYVEMNWELREGGVLGYMLLMAIFITTWKLITGHKKSSNTSEDS